MIRAQGAIVGWTATPTSMSEDLRMPSICPLPASCGEAGAAGPSTFRDGIAVHWLREGREGEPSVALLRYAAGAGVPRHRHVGLETILVLDGVQER